MHRNIRTVAANIMWCHRKSVPASFYVHDINDNANCDSFDYQRKGRFRLLRLRSVPISKGVRWSTERSTQGAEHRTSRTRQVAQLHSSAAQSRLSAGDAAVTFPHRFDRTDCRPEHARITDRHQSVAAQHATIYVGHNVIVETGTARCRSRGAYHLLSGRHLVGGIVHDAVHAIGPTSPARHVAVATDRQLCAGADSEQCPAVIIAHNR